MGNQAKKTDGGTGTDAGNELLSGKQRMQSGAYGGTGVDDEPDPKLNPWRAQKFSDPAEEIEARMRGVPIIPD